MEEPAAGAEEEIPKPVAAPVASPSVRRMARELGIDLSRVRGSEAGGRIVLGDIRAYLSAFAEGDGQTQGCGHGAGKTGRRIRLIFPNGGR